MSDVLPIDGDTALFDIVEPLQQREETRLATSGMADQSDTFSRLQPKTEVFEHLQPAGVSEGNIVECDCRPPLHQRLGLGMVAEFVRHQQCRDRLRQTRDMLRNVDQSHREIARGMQN